MSTTEPGDSGPETSRPSLRQRESGPLPPLPPLPEYTCGACHQTFGSNCDPDDIMCAWCEAQRCPHCHAWFGGEDGVVSPDPDQVTVSREDLRTAAAIADRMNVADSDGVHAQMTAPEMAVFDRLSAAAETGR